MTCDTCGYPSVAFNGYCPICAKNAPETIPLPEETFPGEEYDPEVEYAPPEPPAPDENDRPSFWLALVGFLFPLAGLILYFVERPERPLRGRSALRGAALCVGFSVLFVPAVYALDFVFVTIGEAATRGERTTCRRRLYQLNLAALKYSEANNNRLPDLSSPAALRAALDPYVTDKSIFACPATQQAYVGNAGFSEANRAGFDAPEVAWLFCEADMTNAHFNGSNIAHADGSVRWKRLSETGAGAGTVIDPAVLK